MLKIKVQILHSIKPHLTIIKQMFQVLEIKIYRIKSSLDQVVINIIFQKKKNRTRFSIKNNRNGIQKKINKIQSIRKIN